MPVRDCVFQSGQKHLDASRRAEHLSRQPKEGNERPRGRWGRLLYQVAHTPNAAVQVAIPADVLQSRLKDDCSLLFGLGRVPRRILEGSHQRFLNVALRRTAQTTWQVRDTQTVG